MMVELHTQLSVRMWVCLRKMKHTFVINGENVNVAALEGERGDRIGQAEVEASHPFCDRLHRFPVYNFTICLTTVE